MKYLNKCLKFTLAGPQLLKPTFHVCVFWMAVSGKLTCQSYRLKEHQCKVRLRFNQRWTAGKQRSWHILMTFFFSFFSSSHCFPSDWRNILNIGWIERKTCFKTVVLYDLKGKKNMLFIDLKVTCACLNGKLIALLKYINK